MKSVTNKVKSNPLSAPDPALSVPAVHIGFTGTREGMSVRQQHLLRLYLDNFITRHSVDHPMSAIIGHHGDCVGADSQFHDIASALGIIMHTHPPDSPTNRAFRIGAKEYPPKPYLERNHELVDMCSIIIAAPRNAQMELRSGTWATIRYSQLHNKKVEIIYP